MNPVPEESFTARVPADVERPDEVIGRLTARQVALIGGVGLGLYAIWAATTGVVPTLAFAAAALPVMAVTVAVALGCRDGRPLDAWLLHALRHRQHPHRLTPTHGKASPPPAWIAASGQPQPLPAPLQLPAKGVRADGLIDLDGDGLVALARASTVNFGLRSPSEQNALVAGFARWLHSLDSPTQILVRAQRVDLTHLAHAYREAAPGLPHPALEQAAHAHAAFLTELSTSHELLGRRVTLAARDPDGSPQAALRAAHTTRSLSVCEVAVEICDPTGAAADVAEAARGEQTAPSAGHAAPGAVITTRRSRRQPW